MHAYAFLGTITDAGNFGDAERRSVGSEDRPGLADFVEQSEDLDLRLHLLGHSLNHEIGFARGFLDAARISQAAERCFGIFGWNLSQFNSFIEIAANLVFCPPQSIWQQVFKDGLITAERGHMSDAATHGSGTDHGNGLDLSHYCPPFSNRTTRASRFEPAAFKLS